MVRGFCFIVDLANFLLKNLKVEPMILYHQIKKDCELNNFIKNRRNEQFDCAIITFAYEIKTVPNVSQNELLFPPAVKIQLKKVRRKQLPSSENNSQLISPKQRTNDWIGAKQKLIQIESKPRMERR